MKTISTMIAAPSPLNPSRSNPLEAKLPALEPVPPAGDAVHDGGAEDAAEELGDPVVHRLAECELPREQHPERDRGVDVGAGDGPTTYAMTSRANPKAKAMPRIPIRRRRGSPRPARTAPARRCRRTRRRRCGRSRSRRWSRRPPPGGGNRHHRRSGAGVGRRSDRRRRRRWRRGRGRVGGFGRVGGSSGSMTRNSNEPGATVGDARRDGRGHDALGSVTR